MSKITAYARLTTPASGDIVPIVDVDDTSMAATGTTKGITFANLSVLDWVNAVTQYGADPTGVADSTTPLQNALTAANGTVPVYLPYGTYKTTAALTMPANTALFGDPNHNASVIMPTGSSFTGVSALYAVDNGSEVNGPTLRNLVINGANLTTATIDGIQLLGHVHQTKIDSMVITNMTGWGINCNADGTGVPDAFDLRHMLIDTNGQGGLSLGSQSDSDFLDIYVIGCGANANGSGWDIEGIDNTHFVSCRAEWNLGHGFYLHTAWYQGHNASPTIFTNCTTDRNNWDGMHISGTGSSPIVLSGCSFRRDGKNGSPGSGGGSYAGIAVVGAGGSATLPVIVHGCVVTPGVNDDSSGTNSPQYGMRVTSQASNVSVSSSYLWGATAAISDDGTSPVLYGPGITLAHGTLASPAVDAFPGPASGGVFGAGSDGAITLDGSTTFNNWSALAGSTYTMSRDVYATSLTINSGVTLKPNGWRIFVAGPLVNGGTITAAGFNANGTSHGGYPITSNAIYSTDSGGISGTGAGAQSPDFGGFYAGTGFAGAGGTGSSGAGGAQANITSGTDPSLLYPPAVWQTGALSWDGSAKGLQASVGGASGGGDGTHNGGAGGGGAGMVIIFAWTVANNGTITAAGGNGGTPPTGNCGGGSGGGGGIIAIFTLTAVTGSGSTSVAAGSAGSGVGTGTAGSASGAGTYFNKVLT